MNTPSRSHRSAIALAALYGAGAWLTYAAAEYGFATLVTRCLRSHCGAALYSGSFGWQLAIGYPLIGVATGCTAMVLTRLLSRTPASEEADTAVARALGAATVVWLAVLPAAREFGTNATGMLLWAIVGIGSAAALTTVWRPSLGSRLEPLLNVWAIGLLTQGLLWLRVRHALYGDPVSMRYTLVFGYAAAICVLTALMAWMGWRRRHAPNGRTRPTAVRVLGRPAVVFSAIAIVVAMLNGRVVAAPLAPGAAAKRLPNVIVLVMDTVRADHLSVYGYSRATTPNLQAFARDSVVYTRAFSASDYTLPSLGSLFTGRLPTAHGAHTEDPRLHADRAIGDMAMAQRMLTLPEMLGRAGYATFAVVANYGFLAPRYQLDQGFDLYAVPFPGCAPSSPSLVWQPWLSRLISGSVLRDREAAFSNGSEVNQEIFDVLGRAASNSRPFMLFVDYMDAHWPYNPPPPYDEQFPGKDPAFNEREYTKLRQAVLKRETTLPPRMREHLVSQYDGGIAYLDARIGDVIAQIKAMGLYDDSLIIVTADHGEAFGERQLLEHNVSVYQDQIHVPLIVKYPGRREGKMVDTPVSNVDVTPTVLELVGLPNPDGVQGRSLLSPVAADRSIVSESFPRPALLNLDPRFHRVERAFIEWPHKLIAGSDGRRELYRLDLDPQERQNLYVDGDVTASGLAGRLEDWIAAASVEAGDTPTMDPEAIERLRSLGYVR